MSEMWLTDAEDALLADWWVGEGGDHEDLALDHLSTVVERIVAAREAAVRAEAEAEMREAWGVAARRRNEARRYYVAWMSARMRAQALGRGVAQ